MRIDVLSWLASASAFALVACVGDATVIGAPDGGAPPDASEAATKDAATNDGAANDAASDAGPCPGKTACGGDGGAVTCADLGVDPVNCGACGRFCPSKSCVNGDCTRRVFVSSTTVLGGDIGNSGGAVTVDGRCQTLATAAGLDGTFKAWISDDSTSPSIRFVKSKAPYVRMDGTKIANDWAGLTSGTLFVAINRDEKNAVAGGLIQTWSDTAIDGTEIPSNANGTNCQGWKPPTGNFGSFGDCTAVDAKWTNASYGSCNATWRFYCVEQ